MTKEKGAFIYDTLNMVICTIDMFNAIFAICQSCRCVKYILNIHIQNKEGIYILTMTNFKKY